MAHIIRIDKKKGSGGETHGWQVRWREAGQAPRRYKSRLFSDSVYGSPGQALVAAETFLEEIEATVEMAPSGREPYQKRPYSNNRSGRVGVFKTHGYHGQTGQKQEYWGAFVPDPGGPWHLPFYCKRFYIHAEQSEEEARVAAIEFRQMWEEACDQGEAALRRFWADIDSGSL